jgi:4-hydroxy-tetrahydrodipicolinate reductase
MNAAGIRVAVAGVRGKMGALAARALAGAGGLRYVGGLVRHGAGLAQDEYADIELLLQRARPDVLVDFTVFPASKQIALACIAARVRPVIGTSGYGPDDLSDVARACDEVRVGAVFAPNFAVGAVLMMRFAEIAAKHFSTAEIIEMHDAAKKDAPSGTAMATARRVAGAQTLTRPATWQLALDGARGATVDGVGVHSLRLPGVVAHQQVLLGSPGQTLSISHDSYSRESFMSGMLVAVRAAPSLTHFVDGLDALL